MAQGVEAVENVLRYFVEQLGCRSGALGRNRSRSRESQQEAGGKNNLAHGFFQIPVLNRFPTGKRTHPDANALTKCLAASLLRLFRLLLLLILIGVRGFFA